MKQTVSDPIQRLAPYRDRIRYARHQVCYARDHVLHLEGQVQALRKVCGSLAEAQPGLLARMRRMCDDIQKEESQARAACWAAKQQERDARMAFRTAKQRLSA